MDSFLSTIAPERLTIEQCADLGCLPETIKTDELAVLLAREDKPKFRDDVGSNLQNTYLKELNRLCASGELPSREEGEQYIVRLEDFCNFYSRASFCQRLKHEYARIPLQKKREAVLLELLQEPGFTIKGQTTLDMVRLLHERDQDLFPSVEGYRASPHTYDKFWQKQQICKLVVTSTMKINFEALEKKSG